MRRMGECTLLKSLLFCAIGFMIAGTVRTEDFTVWKAFISSSCCTHIQKGVLSYQLPSTEGKTMWQTVTLFCMTFFEPLTLNYFMQTVYFHFITWMTNLKWSHQNHPARHIWWHIRWVLSKYKNRRSWNSGILILWVQCWRTTSDTFLDICCGPCQVWQWSTIGPPGPNFGHACHSGC